MALNPYINSFETQADYEEYLDGSTAKAPNVAYIRATDTMKYTKAVPNPTWIIYGTTTGTEDFYVGASATYVISSASNGIHMHVEEGIFYATADDVVGTINCFVDNTNGFSTTEGKKVTKIKRWTYPTTNVTTMYGMFKECSGLTSIDLSSFDTTNVTTMGYMFNECKGITTLDLSSFDTTKVTNMSYMFYENYKINKLILGPGFFNSTSLSSFDLSQLTAWTDADSLETFVKAAEVHNGTGKKITLSYGTKKALTQGQKDRITGAGWTI